jgi:uncharacterized membrane protein (UPF0127 family)
MLLLAAAFSVAECERPPPEDFPSRPPTPVVPVPAAASSPATPLAEGRCVLPTPSQPPPPVPPGPAPGCPQDPEALQAPPAAFARVAFPEAHGAAVQAEVVRSQRDTMRGLMYRTSLGQDRGMLFDLGTREDHKFWMHNTCIPLDLLYVDADGLLVGIVENAPTLNDEARGVGCPSAYVLEVNAGWSRKHGVKAGQRLGLPGR